MDGIQEPRRRSVIKKHALPSARVISNSLDEGTDVADEKITLAVMQWTQFFGHDLAHTATSRMSEYFF